MRAQSTKTSPRRVLAIDIGGTKVKALVNGETEPRKAETGPEFTPQKLVALVPKLAKGWRFEAISIGLPALVSANGPVAEPGNLGPGWVGFDFAAAFDCPVRIVNDAAMQALGSYDALIADHVLVGLELGDLRFDERCVSEIIGRPALEKEGKKAWRKSVLALAPPLQKAFLADYVVLGGATRSTWARRCRGIADAGANRKVNGHARAAAVAAWRVL